MANRKTKPTSPGRRFATYPIREQVTTDQPERALTEGIKKSGGRNSNGRITSRHRGGGAKRRYRLIDFKRTRDGIPAKVATIEYDPNRSAYIALLHYADGAKSYILAPAQIKVGDVVQSGPGSDIRPGSCLSLREMPVGTIVHNVELKPGQGGKLGRMLNELEHAHIYIDQLNAELAAERDKNREQDDRIEYLLRTLAEN